MKSLVFILCIFFISHALQAQLNTYVDPVSKDSVISTAFDTLNSAKGADGKVTSIDKVVGIRNIHLKNSKYWLFFYFLPAEADEQQPITVRKGNYAYFGLSNGTYLRLPYNGKTFTYKYPQLAGFFVDVSSYIDQLKNARISFIRLETSNLYHEIKIAEADNNRIGALLRLLN